MKTHSTECVLYRMCSLSGCEDTHTHARAHTQSGCEACTVRAHASCNVFLVCVHVFLIYIHVPYTQTVTCAAVQHRGQEDGRQTSICCPATQPPTLPSSHLLLLHPSTTASLVLRHRKLPQLSRTSPLPLAPAPAVQGPPAPCPPHALIFLHLIVFPFSLS